MAASRSSPSRRRTSLDPGARQFKAAAARKKPSPARLMYTGGTRVSPSMTRQPSLRQIALPLLKSRAAWIAAPSAPRSAMATGSARFTPTSTPDGRVWFRTSVTFALLTDKVVLLVPEEHVEGGQGPVNSRDVLLQVDLLRVRQHLVRVDLGLENAQPVAHHGDLVEEGLDRHVLGRLR